MTMMMKCCTSGSALFRRGVRVPALAAVAACADRGEKILQLSSRDSGLASSAANPLGRDRAVLRAVDYSVTPDRYRDWTRAQRDLDALPVSSTTDRLRVRDASDADVERMVRRLEADPAARRAIEPSGLSIRDYVLTTLALAQAMGATESGGRAQFAGLRRENVEVFNRNRDDFQRFRRDARFRVIDEGDSDDERLSERSDRDSNNDSDKRSDKDSDRQRGRGGRP